MKASQKAYTAGIIDGEGAIMIVGFGYHCSSLMLTIEVGQRADRKEMLDLLQSWWGGRVTINTYHKNRGGSLHYYWTIQASGAKKMLLKILPFLVCKKEQARLGIAFQILREAIHQDMRHKPSKERIVDDSIVNLYETLRNAMKSLNGTGDEAPVTETERKGLIAIARQVASSYNDKYATVHPMQIANA